MFLRTEPEDMKGQIKNLIPEHNFATTARVERNFETQGK